MDLYMLIRSSLIKSDTNGVYLEIFGRGCGQWTGRTDFGPRIAKECFYDYFGHVLFLSVFPRRQSIMYNQPPPSCEIETMFTGLASRIITISYNWSLLNRLLLWKWQVAADMKDSDTKWGMVCMVKMSRIFLVVIFKVILEFFCLWFILDFLNLPIFSLKSRL